MRIGGMSNGQEAEAHYVRYAHSGYGAVRGRSRWEWFVWCDAGLGESVGAERCGGRWEIKNQNAKRKIAERISKWGGGRGKANPKSEYRNPRQYQSSNCEMSKTRKGKGVSRTDRGLHGLARILWPQRGTEGRR